MARRVRRRQRPSAGHPEREFNPLSGLEQNPETATERGESATQRRRRRLPSGRRRAALEPLAAFSWRQPARAKTRRLCPRLRCQFSPRPLRARAALLLQSAGRPSSSGADNLLRLAAPRAPNAIGGAQRATRSAPARTACSCGRAGGREADRPVCGTRRPDEPAQPAAGRANFGAEREQSAPSSSPPQQDSSWIRRRRCASGLLSYPALDESVCVCVDFESQLQSQSQLQPQQTRTKTGGPPPLRRSAATSDGRNKLRAASAGRVVGAASGPLAQVLGGERKPSESGLSSCV